MNELPYAGIIKFKEGDLILYKDMLIQCRRANLYVINGYNPNYIRTSSVAFGKVIGAKNLKLIIEEGKIIINTQDILEAVLNE